LTIPAGMMNLDSLRRQQNRPLVPLVPRQRIYPVFRRQQNRPLVPPSLGDNRTVPLSPDGEPSPVFLLGFTQTVPLSPLRRQENRPLVPGSPYDDPRRELLDTEENCNCLIL